MKHTQAQYSVISSLELSSELSKMKFPVGSILISLDIVSVKYPSVVSCSSSNQNSGTAEDTLWHHCQISETTWFMLTTNSLRLPESYLRVPGWSPNMRGPLSAPIADIFIDYLETLLLDSSPYANRVRFWARYVDDSLSTLTQINKHSAFAEHCLITNHPLHWRKNRSST